MRQSGYVVAGLSVCRIKTTREACTANSLGAGGRVPRWRLPRNRCNCRSVTCTPIASRDQRRRRWHRTQPGAALVLLEPLAQFGNLALELLNPPFAATMSLPITSPTAAMHARVVAPRPV
jgi:hypothetical protein